MGSLKKKILGFTLACLGAFASLEASAQPVLSVSASPNRSRNGEAVMYKIKVQTGASGRVYPPKMDQLKDWELVNSFRSESPSVSYVNGKVEYRYRAEYSYFLRPLKSGSIQIPSLEVQIANKPYKTDPITIQVESLPSGQTSRPPRGFQQQPTRPSQIPPHFQQGQTLPQSDPLEDDFFGNGGGDLRPEDLPSRESFFIRPEYKVKEAYVGQFIELGYVLYQRTRSLRNVEMAKFPDFKGFLKEELFITKNFAQERVQVGNETLLRSEIIRYALFPLKSGELKIDPFTLRAEVFSSPEDLINSLITGAPTPQMGTPIPMEKNSSVVRINVKELPATPPGVIFTGAVGNFQIELKGPSERLSVDQPFTVQFTIAGKGNVKLIEEAALPLPAGLELYETKNTAELRPDTSGYKSFEYLLLPRKNGEIVLESFKWAFFDPQTKNYEVLETPRLIFQIEGSPASPSSPNTTAQKAPERRISPFDVMSKSVLVKRSSQASTHSSVWFVLWSGLGILYLALGLVFFKRRQEQLHSAHLKDNPWEKTALLIHNKEYKNATGLTILVDQWTREYFKGHLKASELHTESSRSEFERVLSRRLPAEFQKLTSELTEFWNQLDLARFAGSEKWPLEIKPEQLFGHAKELSKRIVSRCRFDNDTQDIDDED